MLTLLIADSSVQICNEIEQFCSSYEGIRTLPSVNNGKDALDTIAKQEVDMLLIDIVMPVLDGIGALAKLRQMQLKKEPQVFIHTAFLDNRLLQELQALGAAHCFVKPTSPEHIIPRMLQLLRMTEQMQAADCAYQIQPLPQKPNVSEVITKEIRALGMPAHLRGYHYLRTAIQYFVESEDPSAIAITKNIYPYIAKLYNTRPSLVERSIRNAIEVAWIRGDANVLNRYFGYTIDDCKGKPTNSEFIAMIADRIRLTL